MPLPQMETSREVAGGGGGGVKIHSSKTSSLLTWLFGTILSHKMQEEIQRFLFFGFRGFFPPSGYLRFLPVIKMDLIC